MIDVNADDIKNTINKLIKELGSGADPRQQSFLESLDYLRMCFKYQVFDLEASRRENHYLRELLEENNSS